ncbi:MAG: hypothetical protein QNJ31_07530 [Candidatus Caenarcaniphilales bacterium]|nr:hypothetical protein [Candidatus Caenarcaniphilales bacterium]
MLSDWENKFRQHWPHHYRDVLDKLESPLGIAVVNDTEKSFKNCDRPIVRIEKSFKEPTKYKVIIQDPLNSETLEEKLFDSNELDKSIEYFVEAIGGWEEKVNGSSV